MTDLPATAPITIRKLSLPRPRFPRLGIGALLVEAFVLIGEAVCMAYVAPYASRHRQPQIAPDDDLKGRDPSW
jgi:hypothetical protein